jgi:hypothetical protein
MGPGHPLMRPIDADAIDASQLPGPRRISDDWEFRERLRIALSFFAMLSTAGLAWLVVHREPLPGGDLGSSARATVLFCLVTIGVVLYVRRLPLISFPALFLVVTFMFTCSSLLLYQLEGAAAFRSWEWVDTRAVLLSMPVVMLAFSSFLVGALLLPTRVPIDAPDSMPGRTGLHADTRALRSVGFGVYAVSALFIVGFTLAGSALSISFEGGYQGFHSAKRAGELSQLVASSMTHLLPWSLLILTATCRDRRSRIVVIVLAVPAIVILLAAGDRSTAIPTMVLIASGFFLLGSRIGWRRSLLIAALVVFLIPTVLNLRTVPISDWSGSVVVASATNRIEQTPAYGEGFVGGFLISMSSVYQTLMATVMVIPEQQGYRYGVDYAGSLIVSVPFRSFLLRGLGADIERFEPSQWVLSILHPGREVGPGYLQLAEAYLEFGAIGVIGLYVLLGWSLSRLWQYASSKAWNPQVLAFCLIVIMETLIWVRNSSTLVVRGLAWGWLLVYALPALIRARNPAGTPTVERMASIQGSVEP